MRRWQCPARVADLPGSLGYGNPGGGAAAAGTGLAVRLRRSCREIAEDVAGPSRTSPPHPTPNISRGVSIVPRRLWTYVNATCWVVTQHLPNARRGRRTARPRCWAVVGSSPNALKRFKLLISKHLRQIILVCWMFGRGRGRRENGVRFPATRGREGGLHRHAASRRLIGKQRPREDRGGVLA